MTVQELIAYLQQYPGERGVAVVRYGGSDEETFDIRGVDEVEDDEGNPIVWIEV